MITEGLQNIASGFKKKFNRETVAATVGNPRNATRQMTQRKPAPTKAMGIKKPTVGKVGSVDTAFFTKTAEKKNPKLQKNDSVADVAGKLFSFIKTSEQERKVHFELSRDFEKENITEDTRRHNELVEALKKQREEKEKKKEPEKKEEKKPEEKKKEEEKKPEEKKKEEPKKKAPEKAETKGKEEPKKEEVKKTEAKKEELKKEEPKKEEVKKTEPTKAPEKTAEPVKPAEPVKAPEVKPPTAKPVESPTPSAPTVTIPKPPVSTATSTAAKVVVGAAAISAVTDVKAMIMRHEGAVPYPYKDSKGLWTIGVGHLIGDGKTLPPEYAAWANNKDAFDKRNNTTPAITQKQMQELFEEDYKKHEVIAKKGPGFSKATPEMQGAFVDLSFNMGAWWTVFKKAGKAAEKGDFETVAKELENSKWYNQVGNRAKEVVALIRKGGNNSSVETLASTPTQLGEKIASASTENEDLKKQGAPGTTVIMDNSQTNISQSAPSKQKTLAQGSSPDLPAHQQG